MNNPTEIIVLPAAEYRADQAAIQDRLNQLQRTVEALLNAPEKSKWMTAAEVCELRGFSESTLRNRVAAGSIKKIETADGPRYLRAEVENMKR